MRSHRVWNEVHADNYKASKSFGGEFRQNIAVGSSASYSNPFAKIEVREIDLNYNNWSIFILSVDGEQVKRSIFNNKTKEYHETALSVPALEAIAVFEGSK